MASTLRREKPKSLFFIYQTIIKIVKCYILCIYTVGLISGDLCSRFCNGRNGNNGKQWRHWCATCNDKTCVYKKKSEIQLDRSNKINDFEMYESLHLKVGDNIHCIQLERDLWRVFLKTRESRSLLVVEGLDLETYPFRFMIRTPIQLELLVRETKCSKWQYVDCHCP